MKLINNQKIEYNLLNFSFTDFQAIITSFHHLNVRIRILSKIIIQMK